MVRISNDSYLISDSGPFGKVFVEMGYFICQRLNSPYKGGGGVGGGWRSICTTSI